MSNDFFSGIKKVSLKSDDKQNTSSRRIEEIDISLIDVDEINEQLYGYEDLYKIEQSFDVIGNKSIIYVYERDNGRYLCYAGNQRLIASRKRGERKITCVIDGQEPSKEERIEQLIFMNASRTPKPYYIAKQLSEYEKVLRSKGKNNVTAIIEEKFGFKKRMQQRYKQILTLPVELQELFKYDGVPFLHLLEQCTKIPAGKEKDFLSAVKNTVGDDAISNECIDRAVAAVINKQFQTVAYNKPQKGSQVFKQIMSLPYSEDDIIIPEKKREEIKKQVEQLRKYLDRIEDACK